MEKVTADPAYRKRFLIKGAVYLILTLAAIMWVIPKTSDRLMQTNPATAFLLLEILIFLMLILMMLGWINVFRIGKRCIRERRYPPEGVPVIRDVVISKDQKAVRMGAGLISRALLAMILCIGLCLTLAAFVFRTF